MSTTAPSFRFAVIGRYGACGTCVAVERRCPTCLKPRRGCVGDELFFVPRGQGCEAMKVAASTAPWLSSLPSPELLPSLRAARNVDARRARGRRKRRPRAPWGWSISAARFFSEGVRRPPTQRPPAVGDLWKTRGNRQICPVLRYSVSGRDTILPFSAHARGR